MQESWQLFVLESHSILLWPVNGLTMGAGTEFQIYTVVLFIVLWYESGLKPDYSICQKKRHNVAGLETVSCFRAHCGVFLQINKIYVHIAAYLGVLLLPV